MSSGKRCQKSVALPRGVPALTANAVLRMDRFPRVPDIGAARVKRLTLVISCADPEHKAGRQRVRPAVDQAARKLHHRGTSISPQEDAGKRRGNANDQGAAAFLCVLGGYRGPTLVHAPGHAMEAGNTFLDRRMSAEQLLHRGPGERLDDEQVGRGRRDWERDLLRIVLELLERRGERLGVAVQPRPGLVGAVLAS